MIRIVQTGNALPISYPCDPSASFQPGTIAELTIIGNEIMGTVSNGTAPIGIIDDVKTKAFSNISWNEDILVPAIGVPGPNNTTVTPIDIKAELRRPNILRNSFSSTVSVILNPINGVITFPAGTKLNCDLIGNGQLNGIKAIVNYTYEVANIPGDDSTLGSGKMTIWFERMFVKTDIYETNQQYPLKANLYVSEVGLITTRRPSSIHPAVAMVTSPPNSQDAMIEMLWL